MRTTSKEPQAQFAYVITSHSLLCPIQELLLRPDVLKVGVGIRGDAIKLQGDFGFAPEALQELSDEANRRVLAAVPQVGFLTVIMAGQCCSTHTYCLSMVSASRQGTPGQSAERRSSSQV